MLGSTGPRQTGEQPVRLPFFISFARFFVLGVCTPPKDQNWGEAEGAEPKLQRKSAVHSLFFNSEVVLSKTRELPLFLDTARPDWSNNITFHSFKKGPKPLGPGLVSTSPQTQNTEPSGITPATPPTTSSPGRGMCELKSVR